MMNAVTFQEKAKKGERLTHEECMAILTDESLELLDLIHAAYPLRKAAYGNKVMLHTINNAQNGYCPEDCSYCAQAKTSEADIEKYPIKSKQEILDEAKQAYESGAHRYCMVFAGRGPNERRVNQLCDLIKDIKSNYPIEVCVSAGLVDDDGAKALKEAGLDRLNHNLNTSRERYKDICTTHTYDDRLNTLLSAKKNNLEICSGLIVGMGESPEEIIELANTLRELDAPSIPINYLLPIEGTTITSTGPAPLSPAYCLRVLCLFRFLIPQAELRVAAGRELHFRGLQSLLFFVANSIFVEGYLNTKGTGVFETLQMIEDAGFDIESDHALDDVLAAYKTNANKWEDAHSAVAKLEMKKLADLKPTTVSA